jgi:hypothetical protein
MFVFRRPINSKVEPTQHLSSSRTRARSVIGEMWRVPAAANYMEDGPLQSGEYRGAILAFVPCRMHSYENSQSESPHTNSATTQIGSRPESGSGVCTI